MNKCKVRFILNPNTKPGFSTDFSYEEYVKLSVVIRGRNKRELMDVAENVHKDILIYTNFKVKLLLDNLPNDVRTDKMLHNRLIAIFSGIKSRADIGEEKADIIWGIIDNAVNTHGKAPKFAEYRNPKHREKIKRYLSHTLNIQVNDESLDVLMKQRYQ